MIIHRLERYRNGLLKIVFCLLLICVLIPISENGYAQGVNQFGKMTPAQITQIIQGMTPARRQQALLRLTPEQQKTVMEMLQGRQAGETDTIGVAIEEVPQPFEGLSIPPQPESQDTLADPEVVGMSYFKPARDRILAIESAIRLGRVPPVVTKDAISGYVGPIDMISAHVQIGSPERYFLSPGDEINISYWGNNLQLTNVNIQINPYGEVAVPAIGRIVARGMTLQQFENAAKEQYMRINNPTDFHLIATLNRLKSIRVNIAGEAFRPGGYAVSAVTTLFNALYACGGPGNDGSLRKIRLLRGNTTYNVDFYDYLIKGSIQKDYPLQGGDIIHIDRTGNRVRMEGEVYRTGIYEVVANESLKDLIDLAGGIKPVGLKENVLVETILPNRERVTRDINIDDVRAVAGLKLMDGDRVTVRPFHPRVKNYVIVGGCVKNPGMYELKPDMRLMELVRAAMPLENTYLQKSIITRFLFEDERYLRVAVNLERLLAGDVDENIFLQEWDSLRVYSKDEAIFTPMKEVSILGSVQRPGTYVRSDNMRVSDLIFEAGGLLPDTYQEQAVLKRWNFVREIQIFIPVNVKKAMEGDRREDVELMDSDSLRLYDIEEAVYSPPHEVSVTGPVQRPGKYIRSDSMRVQDLIFEAGGLLPGYYRIATIARARSEKETEIISIDLDELLAGKNDGNVFLDDQDILNIKRRADFYEMPNWVNISGEVNFPGPYALKNKNVYLSEIIKMAGGFTTEAYPRGLILYRRKEFLVQGEQEALLQRTNRAVRNESIIQYQHEEIKNRLALSALAQESADEGTAMPTMPAITGSVVSGGDIEKTMAAGIVPSIAQGTAETVDKAIESFKGPSSVAPVLRRLTEEDLEFSDIERISVDIEDIIEGRDKDLLVKPGDVIYVPRQPRTVSVRGAVNNTLTLNYIKGENINYFIRRAGGYDQDADKERVRIIRMDGAVWLANDIKAIEQGDIIYVPTRVMSVVVKSTTDKILDVIKYAMTTAASIAVFMMLIGKISEK